MPAADDECQTVQTTQQYDRMPDDNDNDDDDGSDDEHDVNIETEVANKANDDDAHDKNDGLNQQSTSRQQTIPLSPGRAAVLKLQEQQLQLVQQQKRAILESKSSGEREEQANVGGGTTTTTTTSGTAAPDDKAPRASLPTADAAVRRLMSRDARAAAQQQQLDLILAEKRALEVTRQSVYQLEQKRRAQTLEKVVGKSGVAFFVCNT
jgi:hypothetical protein